MEVYSILQASDKLFQKNQSHETFKENVKLLLENKDVDFKKSVFIAITHL